MCRECRVQNKLLIFAGSGTVESGVYANQDLERGLNEEPM